MSGLIPTAITHDVASADWPAIAALFVAVDWGEREPDELRALFVTSAVARFATDAAGRTVGVCRAISDGSRHALIVDLVVAPDCQRQGIGRRLLASVCDALAGVRNVHLLATAANEPFYEANGFARQSLAAFVRRPSRERDKHQRT